MSPLINLEDFYLPFLDLVLHTMHNSFGRFPSRTWIRTSTMPLSLFHLTQ
jgi:hypothetical protein